MADQRLQAVREDVQRAKETADGPIRETLNSIEDAIDALGRAQGTDEPSDESDELDAIDEQLRGAVEEADGETEAIVREAHDEFDAYRHGRDTEMSREEER